MKLRSAGADGQPVPFERQTVVPLAVSEPKMPVPTVAVFEKSCVELTVFEKYPYVLVTAVPVAFVKVRFPREERPVTVKALAKRFVEAKVAMVPLVPAMFVTDRFVVVTLVPVTFPRYAFQRRVSLPSEKARSVCGRRFELTRPVRERETPVAEVKEVRARVDCPMTVKELVTVLEAARNPPSRFRVWWVLDPRAVTEASVSASAPAAGQPTPFVRQTPTPMIVAVAKVPVTALKVVPLAVPKVKTPDEVPFVKVSSPREERPPTVRDPALKEPAERVVTVPLVAWKEVAKRAVVVAFVLVTFPRYAFQRREAWPSDMERSEAGSRYPPAAFRVMFPVVLVMSPSPYQELAPLTKAPLV